MARPAASLAHRLLGPPDSPRREITLANLFVFSLLSLGMLGYRLLEGWGWLDGLYMTFITLTTIGYGEVHPLSPYGRAFTILLGLVGFGSFAVIATRSIQLMLTSQRLRLRRRLKMIAETSDHYVLCGYGRIGQRIAQDLARAGRPFVVIEKAEDKLALLARTDLLYLSGDAEEEEVLAQAGIHRARGLILTLPDDSTNIFVTLVARELNPGLFILARMDQTRNRRKLLQAGANKVIAPYEIGADRMAQVLLRPHVERFMGQVLRSSEMNLLMEEYVVTPDSRLAGRTVQACDLRRRYNIIVIAILRGGDGDTLFNPSPDSLIETGDVLILLGSHDKIARMRREDTPA